MYCPKCFNDTLKIASKGRVKITFNGKSKSTSQFLYNLDQDTKKDIDSKIEEVIEDYFSYYSNFQNIDPIEEIQMLSFDFICSNNCALTVDNQINVREIFTKIDSLKKLLNKVAQKYNIQIIL